MTLNRAEEVEYAAIVELANLAYRGTGEEAGWTTESGYIEGPRLTQQQLRADLASRPTAHLLAFRESGGDREARLLGTVWLEPKAERVWYLGLLTVRPELQARQVGRGLLAAAEAYAAERGADRIWMTVINIRVTLIAWYERRGYVLTGATEPFPYGDDRFGTPLRNDLSFVVLEKKLEVSRLVMHRATT